MKKRLIRLLKKTNWYNLRNLKPVSKTFASDRGMPIDRIYIEDFLSKNRDAIRGVTCEIADNRYSKKFGSNVKEYEVLHCSVDNPNVTITGDLSDISTLPKSRLDCFILTQTLNFIYDFKSAISGVYYMLNEGGIALVTVSGISQISRYDYNRWGDYWRFTDISIKKAFEEVFGDGNVDTEVYGNVLSATAFLQGISVEELTKEEIFYKDEDYQVTICIKAVKR